MNQLQESALRIEREDGVLILFVVIVCLWAFTLVFGQKEKIV